MGYETSILLHFLPLPTIIYLKTCRTTLRQALVDALGKMPFTSGLERKCPFSSGSRCLMFERLKHDSIPHSCYSDPLVSHGRHFGRTIHALCNIQTLLTNGLLRLGELADEPEEAFTYE
jgi:hypothetical protein